MAQKVVLDATAAMETDALLDQRMKFLMSEAGERRFRKPLAQGVLCRERREQRGKETALLALDHCGRKQRMDG